MLLFVLNTASYQLSKPDQLIIKILKVGKLRLDNPLDPKESEKKSEKKTKDSLYEQMLKRGEELL